MQTILIYVLKVVVCSGILFLYYHLALRNKRFHYYNRFYLLMSVALSLLLPLLNVELWQFNSSNQQVIHLMNVVAVNTTEIDANSSAFAFSWSDFAVLLYATITLLLLLIFVTGIRKIYRFRRRYPAEKLGTILFINTDLEQAPFSFFRNLFWKNTLDITSVTGKQIFRHELTHIEQKHSWDKLFLRITTLLFWMNPFFWLIQKELGLIHEFIADEKAIENRSAEAFALVLLQSQYGKNIFSPAQSFNYSPVKRRLFMLTTSSKGSYSYARRILALPLLAGTVLLFAFKLKENKAATFSHTNASFVLVVDAGHGGNADGAIGIDGTKEKDINLSIAKTIALLAPEYGITVKMTRMEDVAVDLKARMNIIEAMHPNAFVSVHVNGAPGQQTDKNDMDVYITRSETNGNYVQSRLLGSSIVENMKKDFPINPTLKQRKNEGIYVLDQNPYPAIIVECGYMNNPENLKQLQDAAKTEQLARDILQGVVAYANAAPQTTSIVVTDTTKQPLLYILDGKEITQQQMKQIDANSIESVSVLKDEAALKQYGEKGKNGVVIITSKNSKISAPASASPNTISITPKDPNAAAAANKALKVIDGKVVSNEDLQKLNANDVYSMSVLKDDNAIEKYGEKARDGVIEITTKKGHDASTGKIVKEEVIYSKNDSTVDFTGNTTLHRMVEVQSNDTTGKKEPEKVFKVAQFAPSFPGGNEAWQKYLLNNLKSDVTIKNGAGPGTYTAVVSFIVDENGNISDVKAIKDPGFGTGAEAVRVIKEGPKWIPAKQNGHIVKAETKQAISFRVEK